MSKTENGRRSTSVARSLALLVLATAIGCTSVPMAPLDLDASAKLFEPPADKARIYVYRNEVLGGAIPMSLSLDGTHMGGTGPKTFHMWDVEPGEHTITSEAENTSVLTLETQAGRTYYLWQEVKVGVLWARCDLREVDEGRGRAGVLECKMAQSTPVPD